MVTIRYNKLFNAVNEICDNDEIANVDFIALPPEKVDELTDEEENRIPNLATDIDIATIPEICGEIEVQYEDIQPADTNDNEECIWNPFSSNTNNSIFNNYPISNILEDVCKDILPDFQNYGSFDYFQELFDESIMLMIVKQTNLYARQKNDHTFNLTVN